MTERVLSPDRLHIRHLILGICIECVRSVYVYLNMYLVPVLEYINSCIQTPVHAIVFCSNITHKEFGKSRCSSFHNSTVVKIVCITLVRVVRHFAKPDFGASSNVPDMSSVASMTSAGVAQDKQASQAADIPVSVGESVSTSGGGDILATIPNDELLQFANEGCNGEVISSGTAENDLTTASTTALSSSGVGVSNNEPVSMHASNTSISCFCERVK